MPTILNDNGYQNPILSNKLHTINSIIVDISDVSFKNCASSHLGNVPNSLLFLFNFQVSHTMFIHFFWHLKIDTKHFRYPMVDAIY